MTDNPYHNQHITDFTQCMEQAFNDNNNNNEQQFSSILTILEEMNQRITRLEDAVFSTSAGKTKRPQVEAEVYVTKASLKKVRDAIMNMFR